MTKHLLIDGAFASAILLLLGCWLPTSGADEENATLLHDPDGVVSALMAGDGRLMITAGRSLKIRDSPTGKELRQLHSWPWGTNGISLSGQLVAACGVNDPTAIVWDAATGMQVAQFAAGLRGVGGVALSPDGKYLATKSKEGLLRLWELKTQKTLWTSQQRPTMRTVLAFSPDGSLLASEDTFVLPSGETGSLRLHETATGKERNAPNLGSVITSVAFSPKGDLIALGDTAGRTAIWELKTGKQKHIFQPHSAHVEQVQFSPDSLWLLSAGIVIRSLRSSKDGTVSVNQGHDAIVWQVENGDKIACFPYDGAPPVFSLDGKRIAVSEGGGQNIAIKSTNDHLRAYSVAGKTPP